MHFMNNVLNFSSIFPHNSESFARSTNKKLSESIHKQRHEKHHLLTFCVESENNTGSFFSFPH